MPLGVLVTLANPGAIATSDLFRRFEIVDINNNNNNNEVNKPLEKFPFNGGMPFDGDDSFARMPLKNKIPLDDQNSFFQHQHSSLSDNLKIISRLRKIIINYGSRKISSGSGSSSSSGTRSIDYISSNSDDSSPYDIINKPLIFSIPGL